MNIASIIGLGNISVYYFLCIDIGHCEATRILVTLQEESFPLFKHYLLHFVNN